MTPGILRDIAERKVTAFLFALACVTAAWYFGSATIFDPIIIISVVILAVIFRNDVNVISLIGILVAGRVAEELGWYLLNDSWPVRSTIYLVALGIIPRISGGGLKWYLFGYVGLAVTAEIYWFLTGYAAPEIYWLVFITMLVAVVRDALMFRPKYVYRFVKGNELKFIPLDETCRQLYSLYIVAYSMNTFEYYIRHILGYRDMTFFWTLFPYIAQSISLMVIYVLFVESTRHITRSQFHA